MRAGPSPSEQRQPVARLCQENGSGHARSHDIQTSVSGNRGDSGVLERGWRVVRYRYSGSKESSK